MRKQYRIVCDMELYADGKTKQFHDKSAPLSKLYYDDLDKARKDRQMIDEMCKWENLSYSVKKASGRSAKYVTNIRIQEREITEWIETND